ncbi:MAG: hypothetical protein SV377_04655 [Halobacteria archaeon]|nr:hypothetical protein [Halobacteria archaeon]
MATELTESFSFEIGPDPPYDPRLTLRKPSGWDLFTPYEVHESNKVWSALTIDREATGVKFHPKGSVDDPSIDVSVYSKASIKGRRERIKDLISEKVAPDVDIEEFYEIAEDDPILRYPVRKFRGMYPTTGDSIFSRALLAITLQQTSIKRARNMRECIVKSYGDEVSFDGKTVYAYPTAETIVKVSEARLREECKVGYRAKYIKGTTEKIADGFLALEDLKELSLQEAREELQKLPGVGDYSADIINPYRGCPIDSWSAEVFGKLLLNDDSVSVREAKKAATERWGEWAWLAFAYVVQDLEGLSKELGLELRLE